MIQANELRIDNFLIDYEGKIGKVKTIEDYNVLKVVNKQGVLISYCEIELYKPIPLTEEILLKCGLKWKKDSANTSWLINNDVEIFFNKGKLKRFISYKFCIHNCRTEVFVKIKHLHQLQNLYFALTNTELNIEL